MRHGAFLSQGRRRFIGMGIGDPVQAYCTATRLTYVKQITMDDFFEKSDLVGVGECLQRRSVQYGYGAPGRRDHAQSFPDRQCF